MTDYWDNNNITTEKVSLFGTSYQQPNNAMFSFPSYNPDADVNTRDRFSDPNGCRGCLQNPPMQYSAVDLLRMLGDRISILPPELSNELLNAISSSLPIEEEWVQQALIYVPDFFS